MLDLGWPEMLVIAIILIVVVGPKDLPKMLRAFGRTTSKMRTMAGEFRKQFDDAMKEAELDELKNLASDARKLNPASELKKAMSPMEKAAKDVKSGLDAAMKPTAPASSGGGKTGEPTKAEAAPAEDKPAPRPIPEAAGAKRAEATAAAARAKTKPAASAGPAKPTGKSASRAAAKPKTAGAGTKTGGTKS
jgi:sec-independent protein translocase protein TatB